MIHKRSTALERSVMRFNQNTTNALTKTLSKYFEQNNIQ